MCFSNNIYLIESSSGYSRQSKYSQYLFINLFPWLVSSRKIMLSKVGVVLVSFIEFINSPPNEFKSYSLYNFIRFISPGIKYQSYRMEECFIYLQKLGHEFF